MPPDLLYGCLHLCYIFHPWWVCIPVHKTLNIAHDSYTFHETFIVPLHSFLNSIAPVSVHTDHWKEWPAFLLLCSSEERESYRFEMAWEWVQQSVCLIVCWPSARISNQLFRGWFIVSHYSKVCKHFFTFPFSCSLSPIGYYSSVEIWNRVIIVNKN